MTDSRTVLHSVTLFVDDSSPGWVGARVRLNCPCMGREGDCPGYVERRVRFCRRSLELPGTFAVRWRRDLLELVARTVYQHEPCDVLVHMMTGTTPAAVTQAVDEAAAALKKYTADDSVLRRLLR